MISRLANDAAATHREHTRDDAHALPAKLLATLRAQSLNTLQSPQNIAISKRLSYLHLCR